MNRRSKNPVDTAESSTPSKTSLKKKMHELQALGETLLELPAAKLATVPMPETLQDAVMLGRKMNKFGALNRQKQFIGKLMRQLDAEPIRDALAAIAQEGLVEKQLHKCTEDWRDRLLSDGSSALEGFLKEFPECDRQQLRQIIKAHDKATSEIVLTTERKKLYRFVRAILETGKQAND